jgi:hypothetical protein
MLVLVMLWHKRFMGLRSCWLLIKWVIEWVFVLFLFCLFFGLCFGLFFAILFCLLPKQWKLLVHFCFFPFCSCSVFWFHSLVLGKLLCLSGTYLLAIVFISYQLMIKTHEFNLLLMSLSLFQICSCWARKFSCHVELENFGVVNST